MAGIIELKGGNWRRYAGDDIWVPLPASLKIPASPGEVVLGPSGDGRGEQVRVKNCVSHTQVTVDVVALNVLHKPFDFDQEGNVTPEELGPRTTLYTLGEPKGVLHIHQPGLEGLSIKNLSVQQMRIDQTIARFLAMEDEIKAGIVLHEQDFQEYRMWDYFLSVNMPDQWESRFGYNRQRIQEVIPTPSMERVLAGL